MEAKVIININDRWEKGISHDPRSVEIFEFLKDYDFKFCDDWFCWKSGGDGDNGENLMYELDEYFANKDLEDNDTEKKATECTMKNISKCGGCKIFEAEKDRLLETSDSIFDISCDLISFVDLCKETYSEK